MTGEDRIIALLEEIREDNRREFSALNQRMAFLERRIENVEKPLGETFTKLLYMVSDIHEDYLERHPPVAKEN